MFKSIKDAKSLLQAIKKRFRRNVATKKTQRNLLKQQYENFTSSSSENGTHIPLYGGTRPEIDTLILDDLYNNLKIYEPEVKGTSSSSSNTQNIAFLSSNSTINTNGAINTAHSATTASTQATAVNSTIIDNLSDAVLCAFFASWEVTDGLLLTMRAGDSGRTTGRKFMLMVSTNSNCSSSCLENVKILKEQNEQLLKDLRISKLNAITYKIGLESVEARLLVYKKNESVYEEDIKVLKCEIHLREVAITELWRKWDLFNGSKTKRCIKLTVESSQPY
ncbi:hypothetical protein Tco_0391046 [Tanacetum coccineum]